MNAPLQPYRRAKFEATLTALRDALGAAGFAAAWAEGAAWKPDQAVAVVLEPTLQYSKIVRDWNVSQLNVCNAHYH
jgi:hypothetical protein